MLKMKNICSAIVLVIITSSATLAQPKFKKRYMYQSLGAQLGTINYVGDVDPGSSFFAPAMRYTRPSAGINYMRRMGPRYSVRGNFYWGVIKGNDRVSTGPGNDIYRLQRNLSFRNTLWELTVDGVVDLFPNRKDMRRRVHFTPYAFAGVGLLFHNPKAELNGKWVALKPLGTEGQNMPGIGQDKKYHRFQFVIPYGVGVRYKLSMFLDLALQIGWRYTFTDYLDDVSYEYVDKSLFAYQSDAQVLSDRSTEAPVNKDNIVTRVGSDGRVYEYVPGYGMTGDQRGDIKNDWYVITAFQLNYIIHPNFFFPKFR